MNIYIHTHLKESTISIFALQHTCSPYTSVHTQVHKSVHFHTLKIFNHSLQTHIHLNSSKLVNAVNFTFIHAHSQKCDHIGPYTFTYSRTHISRTNLHSKLSKTEEKPTILHQESDLLLFKHLMVPLNIHTNVKERSF